MGSSALKSKDSGYPLDLICNLSGDDQFRRDPVAADITNRFIEIGNACAALTGTMDQIPLGATSTSRGKNYVVFSPQNGKQSRPINIDLYSEGLALDDNGNSKIEVFWHNVLNQTIANQPAEDITTSLYVIAMDYFICSDTVNGVGSNCSKYFEIDKETFDAVQQMRKERGKLNLHEHRKWGPYSGDGSLRRVWWKGGYA